MELKRKRKMDLLHAVLPVEILEDILLRLPVKSFGILRCVSKSWKSLLTSQDFINTHLRQLKASRDIKLMIGSTIFAQGLNASKAYGRRSHVSIETQYIDSNVHGSCNGLLLLSDSESDDSRRQKLWLLNPTTGESKILPDPVPELIEGECFERVGYGFVYSRSFKDYKIYRIRSKCVHEQCDIPNTEILLYSLRRNKWKKMKETCADLTIYPGHSGNIERGIVVSGALHWMAVKEEQTRKVYSIVAIDVEQEMFRSDISVPCCGASSGVNIGALDGKLCSIKSSNFDCEIWIMQIYGSSNSWTKIHTIQTSRKHFDVEFRPLCFINQYEDILGYNFAGLPFIVKKKGSKLKERKPKRLPHSNGIVVYIESLVVLGVSRSCGRRK